MISILVLEKMNYLEALLTLFLQKALLLYQVHQAGKSTLMDMLLGLVEVDSGLILINGININDYDLG